MLVDLQPLLLHKPRRVVLQTPPLLGLPSRLLLRAQLLDRRPRLQLVKLGREPRLLHRIGARSGLRPCRRG